MSIAIPAKSNTTAMIKIILCFGTIAVEMLAQPIGIFMGWASPTNGECVADRYATLSLMIM